MVRYRGFYILLPLIIASSCFSRLARNRCANFKNGIFKSHSEIANIDVHIIRADTLQIEVPAGTLDTLKSRVHWKDECSYELTYLYTDFAAPGIVGRTVKVKIVEVKNDYYIYEAVMDGVGSFKDTLFHVER